MPGAPDDYLFTHPLTRDAAYQLMPPSLRAELHSQAAEQLMAHGGTAVLEAAGHLAMAIRWAGGYTMAGPDIAGREAAVCRAAAGIQYEAARLADAAAYWERVANNPAVSSGERAASWVAGARALMEKGDRLGADRMARRAVTDAEPGAVTVDILNALLVQAAAADRGGESAVSRRLATRALDVATRVGDRRGLARAIGAVANVDAGTGNIREAEEGYVKVIAIAIEEDDRHTEALFRTNLGAAFRLTGRIPEAIAEYRRAEEIAAAAGFRRALASAVGNRGIALRESSQYAEAEDCYRRALAMAIAGGDLRSEGIWSGNLASIMKDGARDAEADRYFKRALSLAREIGDRRGISIWQHNRATIAIAAGRLDEAEAAAAESLEISESIGDRSTRAWSLTVTGEVLAKRGRFSEAESRHMEAYALADAIGEVRLACIALVHASRVRMEIQQPALAEEAARRALTLIGRTGDPTWTAHAMTAIAKAVRAQRPDDPEAAELDLRATALAATVE